MKNLEHIYFKNRLDFRNWLENNHDKSPGVWMIYYKKHVKTECIKYNDALEEALCFGWIDSIIKKIDEEKYMRKFTPRTDIKKWSDLNKKLVFKLMQNGEMTQAGLSKIDKSIITEIENINNKSFVKDKKELDIPDFIINEFEKNEPALTNFNGLANTYKKNYVLWIISAKGENTINKRLKEAIGLLKENKKLGLK